MRKSSFPLWRENSVLLFPIINRVEKPVMMIGRFGVLCGQLGARALSCRVFGLIMF